MSGWLVISALASSVLMGLWGFAKVPRSALVLAVGAVLLAMVGYAWQGHPGLVSAPALALREGTSFNPTDAAAHPLKPAFTREDMALNTADAMIRAHNSFGAVALLQEELKGEPKNPDLWLGLGNSLVAQGDGQISPAALFAFDRAEKLVPGLPLPSMMHAMALAQGGHVAESAQMMRDLLARTPKDAPWRADLLAKLAAVEGHQ